MSQFNALQELENFYDAMMPAQEKSKESFVWFSGIPHPLFNAVMHVTNRDKMETLISEAPKEFPLAVWVHPQNEMPALAELLKERSFQFLITCGLMSWDVKSTQVSEFEIRNADLEIFYTVLAETFLFDDRIKKEYANLMGNVEAENYLVYQQGQPVGTGTLVVNGSVGGIFNVATLPQYQKKGCGRAMMQFLMHRAELLRLKQVVLLSSPVAEKLYEDLGFIKHFPVEIYAR